MAGCRPAMPGFIDRRGHLVIIDRAKDVGKLADGTSFAPQFIENKLKFSPYIGEAVVFGDGSLLSRRSSRSTRPRSANGPSANLAYTSFQDLRRAPRCRAGARRNPPMQRRPAARPPAIRRFLVLNKEFDADDDEITRTRKIRRRFVAEKYAALIDALYGGAARSS